MRTSSSYKKTFARGGFTLIETLVSILILFVIMTAGVTFYFHSNKLMTLMVHKKMASEIANSRMETLKRDGYTNLPAAGSVTTAIMVGGLTADQTVDIQDIDENPPSGTDYKKVSVLVEWTEPDTVSERAVNLATFMAP